MNIFLESHKNLLEELIKANAGFLIIGGLFDDYSLDKLLHTATWNWKLD